MCLCVLLLLFSYIYVFMLNNAQWHILILTDGLASLFLCVKRVYKGVLAWKSDFFCSLTRPFCVPGVPNNQLTTFYVTGRVDYHCNASTDNFLRKKIWAKNHCMRSTSTSSLLASANKVQMANDRGESCFEAEPLMDQVKEGGREIPKSGIPKLMYWIWKWP